MKREPQIYHNSSEKFKILIPLKVMKSASGLENVHFEYDFQNVDPKVMDLLALTQQFNIELTPDQVEKVKSKGMSSPSPPLFPPPQSSPAPPKIGDFSNSWNSLLYPQKETPDSTFPSAHGDFSPPTFPHSFSPTPPPPPTTTTTQNAKLALSDKSSSFDHNLLKGIDF